MNLTTKLVICINLFILLASFFFLKYSYTEAVDVINNTDKAGMIQEMIRTETNIELIKEYAISIIDSEHNANKVTLALLEFIKYLMLTFCTVAFLNIYVFFVYMKQVRDLKITRTDGANHSN